MLMMKRHTIFLSFFALGHAFGKSITDREGSSYACTKSQNQIINRAMQGAKQLAADAISVKNDTLWELVAKDWMTRIFAENDGIAVQNVYQQVVDLTRSLPLDPKYRTLSSRSFSGFGCAADDGDASNYCSAPTAGPAVIEEYYNEAADARKNDGASLDSYIILCSQFFALAEEVAEYNPSRPYEFGQDQSSEFLRQLVSLFFVKSRPIGWDRVSSNLHRIKGEASIYINPEDFLLGKVVSQQMLLHQHGCETYQCVTTLATLAKNETLLPDTYRGAPIKISDYIKQLHLLAQWNSGSYSAFALLAHSQINSP